MESNKTQVVLYMYDKLIHGSGFSLDEVVTMFKISERTFRRYISEINCYFINNYIFKQIIYLHKDKMYSLCSTL